jgi:uncharacterized iron-regulated protein
MTLAAAKYLTRTERVGATTVATYFFPEDAALAEKYLARTIEYLDMYEKKLGPYPYRRFAVVENVADTGYSMPTYTLLGRRVVRLPFILDTSLGHEVLHQWFGNSVYADPARGNWAEGLTSYLADHLQARRKGEDAAYRKRLLADFQGSVTRADDFPLTDFLGRADLASRAVGYGKGLMFFHMLKAEVGDEAFGAALGRFATDRRFMAATWDDLRTAFERASGADLGWFFSQWTSRTGAADFVVRNPMVSYREGRARVTFDLVQRGDIYRYKLPLTVVTDKGNFGHVLDVRGETTRADIAVPEGEEPLEFLVDPRHDLMRRLAPREYPPSVSRLMGGARRIVVVPASPAHGEEEGAALDGGAAADDSPAEIYASLIERMEAAGFAVRAEDAITDAEIRDAELLVLGTGAKTLRRLFASAGAAGIPGGIAEMAEPGFYLNTVSNPIDPHHVVAVAYGASDAEVAAAAPRIVHYGRYARLVFRAGVAEVTEEAGADIGIRVALEHAVRAVRPARALTLGDIISAVKDKDVVYVGEGHTLFQDHRVQLGIIRGLREAGVPLAIGMEMFEQPSQTALDSYIAGETDETRFLKDSRYFSQWGFDYNYYREILSYARAHKIPVVALNIPRGIIGKVAGGGLDALSPEDRKYVSPDMDMADSAYRERLAEVLRQHNRGAGAEFENFYQAQVLWDEGMAHAAHEYMAKNPGRTLVVLAGQGHIAFGSGIPKRLFRLGGGSYATIIGSTDETLDPEVADYVVFAAPLPFREAPLLGVSLAAADGRVEVTGFGDRSPARAAGVRAGDTIVAIDGAPVSGADDIRIALVDKRPGETARLTVKRKALFRGERELTIDVAL